MRSKFLIPIFTIAAALAFLPSIGDAGDAKAEAKNDILVEYARFYRVADLPQREGRPAVQEYFSYTCNLCLDAEPFVRRFEAIKPQDLSFKVTPLASDNMASKLAQYAFTAAKLAGVKDTIHSSLFARIHTDPRPFETKDDVRTFFSEQGVLEAVAPHLESERSRALRHEYFEMGRGDKVVRTPTFIVNGRYEVRWGSDQTPDKFAQLLVALATAPPAEVAALSKWALPMGQCTAGDSACSPLSAPSTR